MIRTPIALLCAGALAISACQMTIQEGQGAVMGGALAAITLAVLDADPAWLLIGTAAGAAAGAMIARNSKTNECAYADGRGGYYKAPCR